MKLSLRNIKKISIADVSQLKDICKTVPAVGAVFESVEPFTELPIVGKGECQQTSKKQDRQQLYTVTLVFNLSKTFQTRNRAYAFLLETVDKELFLLGTPEHPYCKITIDDIYPSKVSDKSICKVTVEITALNGLYRVIIP